MRFRRDEKLPAATANTANTGHKRKGGRRYIYICTTKCAVAAAAAGRETVSTL